MLYTEIISVSSEILSKYENTQYGFNVEFFTVKSGDTDSNL